MSNQSVITLYRVSFGFALYQFFWRYQLVVRFPIISHYTTLCTIFHSVPQFLPVSVPLFPQKKSTYCLASRSNDWIRLGFSEYTNPPIPPNPTHCGDFPQNSTKFHRGGVGGWGRGGKKFYVFEVCLVGFLVL